MKNIISNMLYKCRFGQYFLNVLVAGIDPTTNEPLLGGSDSVGAMNEFEDFFSIGTGDDFAMATCECGLFT